MIEKTNMERARHVEATGSLAVAVDITKAVSLLDAAGSARDAGDFGSAKALKIKARSLLLRLVGIEDA